MKRWISLALIMLMVFALAACGSSGDAAPAAGSAEEAAAPTPTPEPTPTPAPDLTGEWKQTNSEDETAYHMAKISGDVIEINWVSEEDDMNALYWCGTFVAPTTPDEPYTWESVADHEKTDAAILASMDDTKVFTYEDGVLSYEAGAMGVTKTFTMEKVQ